MIEGLRKTRRERLERKFNNGPVKVFCCKMWTLEYDIALSKKLRNYLTEAVAKASEIKKRKSYEMILGEDDLDKEIDGNIHNENDLDIAYKIFRPFTYENSPSKAVTAQLLAELMIKNKDKLISRHQNGKEIFHLRDDKYIKYIVRAIDYTCDKQKRINE